jgi:hypothetical protein
LIRGGLNRNWEAMMVNIRDEMPVLARHEGIWTGTYTLIDCDGKILDRHQSHLTCEFPADDPSKYSGLIPIASKVMPGKPTTQPSFSGSLTKRFPISIFMK